jgi:hypothetical protein
VIKMSGEQGGTIGWQLGKVGRKEEMVGRKGGSFQINPKPGSCIN